MAHSVITRYLLFFCNLEVVREHFRRHDNFVIVLVDKASNNFTFVCKILLNSI